LEIDFEEDNEENKRKTGDYVILYLDRFEEDNCVQEQCWHAGLCDGGVGAVVVPKHSDSLMFEVGDYLFVLQPPDSEDEVLSSFPKCQYISILTALQPKFEKILARLEGVLAPACRNVQRRQKRVDI
jgi:hypothetical protein